MTITITHKGTTVCIQQLGSKPEVAIQLIKETIDKINAPECDCEKTPQTGYEYEFSDCLQSEKAFLVEWQKGILSKIEKHHSSVNSFVSNNQYFVYCREIKEDNKIIDVLEYLINKNQGHPTKRDVLISLLNKIEKPKIYSSFKTNTTCNNCTNQDMADQVNNSEERWLENGQQLRCNNCTLDKSEGYGS